MKKHLLSFLLFFLFCQQAIAAGDFITRWNLATSGSGATQISFGVAVAGAVPYTWTTVPAGTSGSGTIASGSTLATITGLPSGAIIELSIDSTNFRRFFIANNSDRSRLTDVVAWGKTVWNDMGAAFQGCNNLNITATDIPKLSGVVNMANMFRACSILNGPANINDWNVSAVNNMSAMFFQATAFNQNLCRWNVANVIEMGSMFQFAAAFNNGGVDSIRFWNTGNVTNMGAMFGSTRFNQPIGAWNTVKVTNMGGMFQDNTAFNQPIGSWNTGNVTTMASMFVNDTSFNQNISAWNTSKVTTMNSMFSGAKYFNNGGVDSIKFWNTAAVTNMSSMFLNDSVFNQEVGTWNTGAVTNMANMFNGAKRFNNGGSNSINNWNTAAVTNMSSMFSNAWAFNQPIGNWITSNVTNMSFMFFSARVFNQNIGTASGKWITASVTNMLQMFNGASAFNNGGSSSPSMDNWNTAAVTNMLGMFANTGAFNQYIGSWNTANVTNMAYMFQSNPVFNQNIGAWNTGNVTDMTGMFWIAQVFNQDISAWNTSKVTGMSLMFNQAFQFNQDITGWNVGNVTNMNAMFSYAFKFNQDISGWNTIRVKNMGGMLAYTTVFNQNLANLKIDSVTNMTNMLDNSGISLSNYDDLLSAWANPAKVKRTGVTLGAANLKYCNSVSDKATLIAFGMIPTGDILGCAPGGVTSSTIQYWLKGSTTSATPGAGASSWTDAAGKNINFTQATAANQPTYDTTNTINFNPVMSFDGTNDFLTAIPVLKNNTFYNVAAGSRTGSSNRIATTAGANSILGSTTAWAPATASSSEFLTLDLGAVRPVDGFMTNGRNDTAHWVTKYMISHSTDGVTYTSFADTFNGNFNQFTAVIDTCSSTIHARFIRVFPITWNVWPAMRIDVFTQANAEMMSFVVSKEDARQDNVLLSLSNSSATDQYTMTSANASGNMLSKGLYSPNATSSYNLSTASPIAVGKSTISSFTNSASGNVSRIYSDGSLKTSGVGAYIPLVSTQSLGGLSTGSNFKGKIAENITYFLTPTALQLAGMHSYLAFKYGITLSQDQDGDGTTNEIISGSIREGDYLAANGTTVFWTANANPYRFRLFGIGRDDREGLHQRIGKSQDTGSILTISTDNNFSNQNYNHSGIVRDSSFAVVGDNNGQLIETTINLPSGYDATIGCGYRRLRKQWRAQLTNFNTTTQPLNLQFDLTGITVTGTTADQFKLIIDTDGDGSFATGTINTINASSFASNKVSFNGVIGIGNGQPFALVTSGQLPVLVASGSRSLSPGNCESSSVVSYTNSFPDQIVLKIDKNGNSITPDSVIVSNEGTLVGTGAGTFSNTGTGYYQSTDGAGSTVRITKRLHTVVAPGTFTVGGGVKVRVYYSAADTANMVADAWPGGGTKLYSGWFKSKNHTAQDVINGMTPGLIMPTEAITPTATGTEAGVLYAEFTLSTFSTIGYVSASTSTPLPIKLLAFDAVKLGSNAAQVNWASASETNAKQYDVMRSVDGNSWSVIGTLSAKGDDSKYTIVDNQPYQGKNYYRLKMVDMDGTFNYGPTKVLNFDASIGQGLNIYPNPAKDQITLSFESALQGTTKIQVYNQLGQLVLNDNVTISGLDYNLSVANLAKGVYTVKASNADQIFTMLLVIE